VSKARILIADDTAMFRAMLRDSLERAGYEVVGEAQNGAEAIDQYEKFVPDLVAMDLVMPETNGIMAIQTIRERYPEARILGCSALGQEKFVNQALQAGAVGFISKPFDEEKVLTAVGDALAGRPIGPG